MSLSDLAYGGGSRDNFDDAVLLEEHPSVRDARARLALAGVGGLTGDLNPFDFDCAADLFAMEFPPTTWLVRGLMTPESVYAVAGEAKTSKTWAALDIAMAIATGTKAFGEFHTGEPRHVVYYAVEDNQRSLRNRLRALAASRKMNEADACRRIHYRSMSALSLTSTHDLARLVASVEKLSDRIGERPALLAFDPLRDLHSEEENDSTAMAKVTHALRAVRSTLGLSCLFVHHSSKQSEGTKSRRPGQRMRGSSVIHGAVDGGLYLYDLKQEEADESHWRNTAFGEVKGAKQAGEFGLALAVEDDDDGEAIAARWEVKKGGVKGEETRSSVLAALRAMPAGEWVSVESLRDSCGRNRAIVRNALYDLQREGLAERSLSKTGPKAGWRIASKEVRPIRPNPAQAQSEIRPRPLGRAESNHNQSGPGNWAESEGENDQ